MGEAAGDAGGGRGIKFACVGCNRNMISDQVFMDQPGMGVDAGNCRSAIGEKLYVRPNCDAWNYDI